jgi:hypothetical protein
VGGFNPLAQVISVLWPTNAGVDESAQFFKCAVLGQERFDIRFNVGLIHNTGVRGGDAATSVNEVGDGECVDGILLGDPVVAHQYWVIDVVSFDERLNETPGLSRPFQVFVENVHGNSNYGQALLGVGLMNLDERWNFFDAASALRRPKVQKKRLALEA